MTQFQKSEENFQIDNTFLKFLESKKIKYTPQQMQAIFHANGPALVLAVPGSGKTTTIIGRIGHLILNHNVNPKNILAITFSKASALDMRKRFKNIFGDMARDDLRFSTIHAFANMVVSSYNRKFNKNLVLLKSWQINYIIKDIYKDIFKEEASEDKLEPYITGISYIKNKMLSKDDIEKYEGKTDLDEIGIILDRYDELKREKNWYDYDDMLELCLGILKENRVTLEFLREKYKYILLDEGQDTSKLQFEIIKLLIQPKNNIFIVADDDQTIYDFRGACPEQLLEIRSFLPNIKTYFMEQNFRSTKEIIGVANNVIRNNKSRYDKTMFTNKKESGKSVDLIYLEDTQEQSKYIVEHIINKENGIALLYRNNLSAIPVANILHKSGIKFYINNYKTNFFNHWIVKDIMYIIRLINDSSDVEALSNIYYKIKTYLNKNMINRLVSLDIYGEDVFEYIIDNFELKGHVYDRILTLKICFEEARKKKVGKGIKDILSQIDYTEYIEKMPDKSSVFNEIISTIIEVLCGVDNYSEANEKILELREIIEASTNNIDSNIFLSTFHGSKGLEFNEVYLLNILDSVIPAVKKTNIEKNKEEVEADRKLFYVGLTRAKNKLKIIVPGVNESIFVKEMFGGDLKSENINVISKTQKNINYPVELVSKSNEKIQNEKNICKNNLVNIEELKVGTKVIHTNPVLNGKKNDLEYKGIISNIEENKIEIDFDCLGKRTYLLNYIIDNNLIKII
ncbi:ATP-dependent helicase [Clostridium beijerinckii]|uniref:DNA 3'-5' helicase n=1 Tax=Clostridium beijerinckii TaxID=1520 RepID=A0AAX0B270_CLOBE|nr:ATP-dependent helicase [Clostridium beijerinckii]NRT88964.1 DNA helicase-2/ATP-dependent DNA helicase PcrA [Clostridium beijerinckii]NYC74419.1 DNA helicase-2/ATP-dependent DNA helicase PcrA [Clostridium beijerinckii]